MQVQNGIGLGVRQHLENGHTSYWQSLRVPLSSYMSCCGAGGILMRLQLPT